MRILEFGLCLVAGFAIYGAMYPAITSLETELFASLSLTSSEAAIMNIFPVLLFVLVLYGSLQVLLHRNENK